MSQTDATQRRNLGLQERIEGLCRGLESSRTHAVPKKIAMGSAPSVGCEVGLGVGGCQINKLQGENDVCVDTNTSGVVFILALQALLLSDVPER
jgi:hypothetical protein